MSKSSKAMVYPLVPAEEWVKRYELFVSPCPCQNCGKMLLPAIPFAYGRWRGLTSAPQGCEENFDVFSFHESHGSRMIYRVAFADPANVELFDLDVKVPKTRNSKALLGLATQQWP